GKHQLLFAHSAGVLNARFFREAQQLRRGFDLEVLEFHLLDNVLHKKHSGWALRAWGRDVDERREAGREGGMPNGGPEIVAALLWRRGAPQDPPTASGCRRVTDALSIADSAAKQKRPIAMRSRKPVRTGLRPRAPPCLQQVLSGPRRRWAARARKV